MLQLSLILSLIAAQVFTVSCDSGSAIVDHQHEQPAGKASQLITCNGLRSYSLLDVELVFIDEFSEHHVGLIQDAVAKWQTVLYANYELDGTQKAPFYNRKRTTWRSYGGEEIVLERGEKVDDLRVYIEATPIDGTHIGLTSVDWIYANQLPLISTISLDTDLLDEDDRHFYNVVLHELGHALGFGASHLGRAKNLLGCSQSSFEGRSFLGTFATMAFDLMGGRDFRYSKVPTSSDWLHWSEEIFGDEVMTPTMRDDDRLPISPLTVAAMADIGYVVNPSSYEDYTFAELADSLTVGFVPDSTHVDAVGKVNIGENSDCKEFKTVQREPRQIENF